MIPLSEDLLLFCILCAKNLGSSKWALNTIPRMSDTDKDITPSFCIIVCYLTIMQVYIFHQSHYIRGKNSKLLYNIPVRVINTCTCFHNNVQVCFLCCFFMFVCFVLLMFNTNVLSFPLFFTKLLEFRQEPRFCFHEHFQKNFFIIIKRIFLKREHRLKW